MRVGIAVVCFLVLINPGNIVCAQTLPPPPDKDPFVGTWKANTNKSQPKLNDVAASYVRTIAREGDDLLFSSRFRKTHSNSYSANHYRLRCDGLPHRVHCFESSCTTSCTYVTVNRVEGKTVSQHKTSYWAREVSSDGQELTIYGYKDKSRKEIEELEVADRVK